MGDFIFAKDSNETNMIVEVNMHTCTSLMSLENICTSMLIPEWHPQVPDGNYIFHLYQTESIAEIVDETTIGSIFRIEDVTTIPERDESISDFYYGM
jgi:hypothetical protein